jgi:hypothetical protein
MNIEHWRRPSVPPNKDQSNSSRHGKRGESNLPTNESIKTKEDSVHTSPGIQRGHLDLLSSTHTARPSLGRRSVASSILTEDVRIVTSSQPKKVTDSQIEHDQSALKDSKHSKSIDTFSCTPDPELLSLGNINTKDEEGSNLAPEALIERIQSVTLTDKDGQESGFLRQGRILHRRESLTLEELTDVLCHINTAEACGLPIQWDLIIGLVQPPDNGGYHADMGHQHESLEDDELPCETIAISNMEDTSLSSISQEGHDLVDDDLENSTAAFTLPSQFLEVRNQPEDDLRCCDMKNISTRVFTGT